MTCRAQRGLAIASVLSAMALVVLDANIVNVALPQMARALGVSAAQSVWAVTAYQAALVMALLPAADLAQAIGHRRVFVAGIAIFTLASLGCAAAPSLAWLVAARFVQGLGGAAIMALGIALLRFALGAERLGRAIGWNALTVALCSAAGPAVGAAILAQASWHWLFLVNLPLGGAALLASAMLPEAPGDRRRPDLVGAAILAAAVACLVVGAELLPFRPIAGLALLACGAPFLIWLWRRELPKQAPLIPLDLLRIPSFRLSVLASVCCFAGQAIALVALPFHLQHGLGMSAMAAGPAIAAWALTVAVTGPLAGRLSARVETGRLSAAGAFILAMGLSGFAIWPAHAHPVSLALPAIVCGAGFGLFQVPNNRNLFLSAPEARSAAAGGMQGTARLTGQTAGAVAMTLLLGTGAIDIAARTGFALGAVLTVAAGLTSLARVPVAGAQAASSCASSP